MNGKTAREKAISCKTLICFLESLVGQRISIELKDDSSLFGLLTSVDIHMNCHLVHVTLIKPQSIFVSKKVTKQHFQDFFLKGNRIRFVEIPDSVDPVKNIQEQLDQNRQEAKNRLINTRLATQRGGKTCHKKP